MPVAARLAAEGNRMMPELSATVTPWAPASPDASDQIEPGLQHGLRVFSAHDGDQGFPVPHKGIKGQRLCRDQRPTWFKQQRIEN